MTTAPRCGRLPRMRRLLPLLALLLAGCASAPVYRHPTSGIERSCEGFRLDGPGLPTGALPGPAGDVGTILSPGGPAIIAGCPEFFEGLGWQRVR